MSNTTEQTTAQQTASAVLEALGISLTLKAGAEITPTWAKQSWTLEVMGGGRLIRLPFHGGGAVTEPNPLEVLASWCNDYTIFRTGRTWEEHAQEFGIDGDSLSAFRDYEDGLRRSGDLELVLLESAIEWFAIWFMENC